MNKSTLLVAALLAFSMSSFVEAQTISSSVNQLLNETNELINEAESELEQIEAEGREYQSYLNGLYQDCMNGNNSACAEYKSRLRVSNTGLGGAIIQTNPNSPRNRGWSDSFCHPYCN